MNWSPDPAAVDAELEELGIPSTREARSLLALLATEPHVLYVALSRLSKLRVPDEHEVPPIDRLVGERLQTDFGHCTERSILRKGKSMGSQCKRLLAVLIRDIGHPRAARGASSRERAAIGHAASTARTRDGARLFRDPNLLEGSRSALPARAP